MTGMITRMKKTGNGARGDGHHNGWHGWITGLAACLVLAPCSGHGEFEFETGFSRSPISALSSAVEAKLAPGAVSSKGETNASQNGISGNPIESSVASMARTIPRPLPEHPGNIYVEGEPVEIVVPPEAPNEAVKWRLVDVDGREIARGELARPQRLALGRLEVGWYRIEFLTAQNEAAGWTAAAVLSNLKAPTPADSPIGLDMSVSWFERNNPSNQTIHANLAALAGVNWARDRLTWNEIQPAPDRYAPRGNYDIAAEIQRKQGLRVLQVFHSTPRWAVGKDGNTSRFAPDLRHVYRFSLELGRRFQDRVPAWEPWNEPNVSSFGGHTMDEICAWQKAAWLGFKASGSKTIVGSSALAAVPTWPQTEGIKLNEVGPYFDTYNIHTYDWAHGYDELWEPARIAAAGKPLWITEADRGAQHDQKAPWYDLPPRLERLKAEYLAQSYASALAAGADRHFQFILGNYQEPNGVQFGLIRKDYTPRPAYAALAAVGRLLAGARCLGRWQPSPEVWAVAFRAAPDGVESDVLVLWTEKEADWPKRGGATAKIPWPEGLKPRAVFDFLGRQAGNQLPKLIGSAPCFVILPPGQATVLPLKQRTRIKLLESAPSPLVLQTVFPASAHAPVEDKPWSGAYAYAAQAGETVTFTLCAYNFGHSPATMTITAERLPQGWSLNDSRWTWTIDPLERATTPVQISWTSSNAVQDGWVFCL